jgi:3-hydroxymyristoyl/3-hydroxydecanoyl-(acyl carrier protein) dehydratase
MESDAHFVVAPDHPAIPGHFPGNPVVPGVLMLAHVQAALDALLVPHRGRLRLTAIPQAKFLAPLAPGEECAIAFPRMSDEDGHTAVRFECRARGRVIATGIVRFASDAGDRN